MKQMPLEAYTGQLIHDAWRSVRVADPAYANDPRLRSSYDELADLHQALCIVTVGRIERAIGRQLISDEGFGVGFVRRTMEEVYEGYNRFTHCLKGLRKSGLDWFTDGSGAGLQSIETAPPYNTLSHASKEIDRRMVILMLNNVDESHLPDQQLEAIRSDSVAILDTAHNTTFYDYTLGYACAASFD